MTDTLWNILEALRLELEAFDTEVEAWEHDVLLMTAHKEA